MKKNTDDAYQEIIESPRLRRTLRYFVSSSFLVALTVARDFGLDPEQTHSVVTNEKFEKALLRAADSIIESTFDLGKEIRGGL